MTSSKSLLRPLVPIIKYNPFALELHHTKKQLHRVQKELKDFKETKRTCQIVEHSNILAFKKYKYNLELITRKYNLIEQQNLKEEDVYKSLMEKRFAIMKEYPGIKFITSLGSLRTQMHFYQNCTELMNLNFKRNAILMNKMKFYRPPWDFRITEEKVQKVLDYENEVVRVSKELITFFESIEQIATREIKEICIETHQDLNNFKSITSSPNFHDLIDDYKDVIRINSIKSCLETKLIP